MFDREQADFVCDYLECLTCSSGVPLRLIDWQRDMVQSFYGEMTEDEDAPGNVANIMGNKYRNPKLFNTMDPDQQVIYPMVFDECNSIF